MRIAIWHNLPSGGGKRALYHLAQGLVERGHHLESWCPPGAEQSFLPLSEFIPEHVVPFEWRPPIVRGRLDSLLSPYREMTSKIAAMERHCVQCAAEINTGGFDVVFAHPCAMFRVTGIGRHVQIPAALYLQEPYRSLYEALPRLPWLALSRSSESPWALVSMKRFVRDLVRVQALRVQAREERDNVGAFDQILVNSQFSRESVLRAYGLDARVSYLGVAVDQFRPLGTPRERLVVGVGTIGHHKGADTAVRAIATIPKDSRPPLVWIGNDADPEYQREVEVLAESLGVSFVSRVDVSDKELLEVLNQAAVMVYTSRLEPFGLAPLEANACETPVVAVAEGGVREAIRHGVNGILVSDRRPDRIGQALMQVLEDSALARRLGEQGRAHVMKEWNWQGATRGVEETLLEVAAKRAAR
jgi:glycosyltransferase involved in cell wall biosynthesis